MKRKTQPAARRANPRLVKGGLVESIRAAYDPEAEFAIKNRKNPVIAFYEKLKTKIGSGSKAKLADLVESASILEVNRFGATRVRRISDSDGFRKAMAEAEKKRGTLRKIVEAGVRFRHVSTFNAEQISECAKISETEKFREDFDLSSDSNAGSSSNPFDEYIPLMGGPFSHQLYLHDFLDMLAKCFEAWNHNPMAHQIVKITTHFVLGRGVNFKSNDDQVQTAFQKWWDANKMTSRLTFWSDMLTRDGELMIRRYYDPRSKQISLRWVDPSTIWEIVTDIEDIENVFFYHQQYPTAYQVLYGAPSDAKFDPTKFESSKYVIAQIPAEEMYHVKENCSPNEKRGRSDLFPILGWLKRYKDFQTAVVLRAIAQASFSWKNKLKGDETDVDAFINEFGTDAPEFGSVYVENESSDLQPMTADLKSGTGLADCPGIVNGIAVGAGIAKEYLGLSDHSTRSTAVVASEPSVKKFQSRQLVLGRLLKDIAADWSKNEIASGRLKAVSKDEAGEPQPLDVTIDFIFPEIAIEDRTAKITDLGTAKAEEAISHEMYSTAVAKELGFENYNYQDTQDEIAERKQEDLSSLYPSGNPLAPPVASGQQPGQPPAPKKAGGLSGQEKKSVKLGDRR